MASNIFPKGILPAAMRTFFEKNPALAKGPPHGYRPKIDQNSDRNSRHNLKNKAPPSEAPQGGGRFAPAPLGFVVFVFLLAFPCFLFVISMIFAGLARFSKFFVISV